MRTAAVVNLKGGVGKSTTAINMALIMSQVHGKKVLLIDNDFQAAVTKFFEKHSYDALSMEEVLRNPILFAQDVIVPSGRWGLDIIPSNMNLVAAADDLITDKDGDQMGRIRHVLNQVEEDYDYCIIDCHPGVGIEVLNALAAAEDIIIPIKADKNALDGMEGYTDGTKAGGFTDGYRAGKTDGYREGHEGGIKAGGFVDGYETGYEVGYKEGSEDERKGIRRLSPGEKIGGTVERRYSNGKDWHRRQT